MSDSLEQTYRPLLEAVSFAARAHRQQVRKDNQTPYSAHVFRVCLIVRHVFGIDDSAALMAGLLHDTIEDTPTDYEDLAERFGSEVAAWVGALTKDMRQPEAEREEAYRTALANAPWQVKLCKLADIFDNTLDSGSLQPEQRARTLQRSRHYLQALDSPDLPPDVQRAWDLVARLLDELRGGDADRVVARFTASHLPWAPCIDHNKRLNPTRFHPRGSS